MEIQTVESGSFPTSLVFFTHRLLCLSDSEGTGGDCLKHLTPQSLALTDQKETPIFCSVPLPNSPSLCYSATASTSAWCTHILTPLAGRLPV